MEVRPLGVITANQASRITRSSDRIIHHKRKEHRGKCWLGGGVSGLGSILLLYGGDGGDDSHGLYAGGAGGGGFAD